jgi:hypothetical protein
VMSSKVLVPRLTGTVAVPSTTRPGPPSLVMEIWLAGAKTALTALAGVVVLCSARR